MRPFLFLSALVLGFVSQSRAQISGTPPEPPACQVYMAFDEDNDGFAAFDLDAYFIQFRNLTLTLPVSYDLSGYTFEFYPSDMDLFLGTNQITTSTYTNIISHVQFCYMKFIYTGSGPFYEEADLNVKFACHVLQTTSTLATAHQTKDFLQLYPNPVSGFLNVKLNTENAFSAKIYDLNGRIIMTVGTSPIDVSKLENGIYLVSVTSEGKQYSQKITVAN